MKERPILFSGPMVCALLEGRKTQTRRIVKHEAIADICTEATWNAQKAHPAMAVPQHRFIDHEGRAFALLCPYGRPGDRLWVRETFGHFERNDQLKPGAEIFYRAEGECLALEPWRPSIHMPRWASRILLEVTGVRVERLQAISDADARAEGPAGHPDGPWHAFRSLWTLINGADSWTANPWVWVVEFKQIPAPGAGHGDA